jgi:hypothetical protein
MHPINISRTTVQHMCNRKGIQILTICLISKGLLFFYTPCRVNFVNELENINWEAVENEPDINAAVNNWNTLFTQIENHHAPVKQTRLKGVSHPWMNSQLSKEM